MQVKGEVTMDVINDNTVLEKEEFEVIKEIIHKLASGVEGLLEINYGDIADDHPLLYDALLELQDTWDSHTLQDAMDTWNLDLDH
jgi:hypothetical protein